jgi:hypothetical protein
VLLARDLQAFNYIVRHRTNRVHGVDAVAHVVLPCRGRQTKLRAFYMIVPPSSNRRMKHETREWYEGTVAPLSTVSYSYYSR